MGEVVVLVHMADIVEVLYLIYLQMTCEAPAVVIICDFSLQTRNTASTADRARHVHIRNNFVFQFLESGKMEIRHCPTNMMLADLLTKPLTTNIFFYPPRVSFREHNRGAGV